MSGGRTEIQAPHPLSGTSVVGDVQRQPTSHGTERSMSGRVIQSGHHEQALILMATSSTSFDPMSGLKLPGADATVNKLLRSLSALLPNVV